MRVFALDDEPDVLETLHETIRSALPDAEILDFLRGQPALMTDLALKITRGDTVMHSRIGQLGRDQDGQVTKHTNRRTEKPSSRISVRLLHVKML